MINSRKISDLDPKVAVLCRKHIALCKAAGIEIVVTSTWRDIESQDALFAIGRTVDKERRPVTNARGGKSWHNYKVAWDFVPIISGKPVWDPTDKIWREAIAIAKSLGLESGADWVSFRDPPHLQMRSRVASGATIELAEAFELFKDKGSIFT